MKENYFTTDNIAKKSQFLLSKLPKNVEYSKISFLPETSALLVIDMQEYFTDSSSHAFIPSATAIIPNIKELINMYKKLNLPVIFTRHLNTPDDAGLMSKWWRDVITEESHLSRIIPGLYDKDAIVINKSQYDAFHNTNLEEILRQNNIKQLVITGVMTHLCCETTIRSAFIREFLTIFPIDATATYNTVFHLSSFINLSHGFTVATTTNKVIKHLEIKTGV